MVGGEERDKNDNGIMVVVVTRINLKDDFHKRVECVLLLLPGKTCIVHPPPIIACRAKSGP